MNCPNCGKPTREGASFCGECGYKLSGVAAAPAPTETPAAAAPLRRPPPPPEDVPAVPIAPAVTARVVPDVAPLLVPPPPPPGVPKTVEVVPFGTTQEVLAPDAAASSITITSPPPGIGEPPAAPAAPFVGTAPPPVAAAPTAESLDETRVSVRRRAGIHWRLVLPDAGHIEVATALLVGRDPAANATWHAAVLLAVDDDTHSVSKTHAVFEVDADGLWVTDLDSTNGVVIAQPDGTELDLDPNVRTAIQPGADVELGDFIIQVEKD